MKVRIFGGMIGGLSRIRHTSPAVVYYYVNRISQFVSVLVTVFLVTTRFSAALQGYYFTLLSLMSVQILADFGFAPVLIQFVSHEWAQLRFQDGEVLGDEIAKGRLASLVRIALGWMGLAAGFVMIVLFVAGYAFIRLSYPHASVEWGYLWLASCLGVALGVAGTIMSSVNMGCNQVAESQRAAAVSTFVSNAVSWVVILAGGGLYALPAQRCLSGLIVIVLLMRDVWPAIKLLQMPKSPHRIDWRRDLWRQQWRIGVSWLSGVAVQQSFVPIILRFLGPVEAGRAGLTLQIYTFANIMSVSWLYVAQPRFGALWSRNDRVAIASLVREVLAKSVATAILLAAIAIAFVALVRYFLPVYGLRFGTVPETVVLMLACVVVQILNVQSSSVRYSKSEPFLVLSLVHAGVVVVLNIMLAPFGVFYVFLSSLLVLVFLVTPWSNEIYRRYVGSSILGGVPHNAASVGDFFPNDGATSGYRRETHPVHKATRKAEE